MSSFQNVIGMWEIDIIRGVQKDCTSAELYPLPPPNMTGDGAFAFPQATCLQELCLPMLNGVLIVWINPKISTKIVWNYNRHFCIFSNTKCLLLFDPRYVGGKKNSAHTFMSHHTTFVSYAFLKKTLKCYLTFCFRNQPHII